MQLFVRDAGHALVEAEVHSTVADVKTAYMLKTYGTVLRHDAIVSKTFLAFGLFQSRSCTVGKQIPAWQGC
jgi:hypothetical protein